MKSILFLLFILFIAIEVKAQFDYDCIKWDEFYLVRAGSSQTSTNATKASLLKSHKMAEQVLGKNYSSKKHFAETQNIMYDNLKFDDGLSLDIPDDPLMEIEFHVSSNKYELILTNGEKIRVGMKADDFKAIFPKSFSKRVIIKRMKGKIGKVLVSVYFSRVIDGQVQIEDSRILFIFNNEKGVLEEFYSYEPS